MIFKFKTPLKYCPTWNKNAENLGEISVTYLTIKKVMIDVLLRNISVLFFEAPSPFVIFSGEGYDLSLSSDKIRIKMDEIIENNPIKLLETIFELEDVDELKRQNSIMSLKVVELKQHQWEREKALSERLKYFIEDDNEYEYISEKMKNHRLDICAACSLFDAKALAGNGACNKCNCPIMYKVKKASSYCPIGKWDSIT